ncbi:MAG: tRNA guanosine(34) transglycosylase Tgt [Myxococcales bacterium]|nr:tRNA guanosine(34) transglycosylase Tgt [Myxococcales bacterium]MCB9531108.1 tRNA guanosine(34) transglycosylase Tgt [Myxococcales bacterium]MCB9533018.1 tRNA guanosine(34) transglycosylase Tgt [Myxococcales bacterium]
MTERLVFRVDAVDGQARAGEVVTRRGAFATPAFMPVGTLGTVKTASPGEVEATGARIILANTYHLFLRPGTATLDAVGGLHRFMRWSGPILTDSGGYQFFSLSRLAKFAEEGVTFRSHLDGTAHLFTPERVIEVQRSIGSDIMMVLDQCPALPAERRTLEEAVDRSTRWAARSLAVRADGDGAMFAIAQGGTDVSLRLRHVEQLSELGFDGYAIGGLAVGEAPEEMYATLDAVAPALPATRPRYLMGVGRPEDIVEAIARGVDMFDCVMPTRNARNGGVFTRRGRLNMRGARLARDERPIDEGCRCYTCMTHSRAYVHHLIRAGEVYGIRLTTLHNLTYYQDVVRGAREAVLEGRFDAWRRAQHAGWEAGESS